MSEINRSDELLYTGKTGASERVQQERAARKFDKDQQKAQIEPLSEVIEAFIKIEQQKIPERLWQLIKQGEEEKNTQSTLLALRMYDEFLNNFRSQLANTLRERKERRSRNG